MRKQIAVTIDEKVLEQFKEFTRKNGMSVSGRIEALIKKDMLTKKNDWFLGVDVV